MNQVFGKEEQKQKVFEEVAKHISSFVRIRYKDDSRPWGGFFVIEEEDAAEFIKRFFPDHSVDKLSILGKLSPKILLVEPGKKLSWQYHHRRAEIWKLISGKSAVVKSDNDFEKEEILLSKGDVVELRQGERHRLVGLDQWGIVAEIWQHTDAENPSDEQDIIRIQDDFGR